MPPGRRAAQTRSRRSTWRPSASIATSGAATGEFLDFSDDIALLGIEHDVRAHSFRHFHSNGIAFHADDQRSARSVSLPRWRISRWVPAQKPTTVSPMRMFADSAPLNPVEAMSASNTTCSSRQVIRNLGQIRLRVWHKQIFGLRAVDGVAESPAADRFAHLRQWPHCAHCADKQAAALTARRDRADQNAVTDLVPRTTLRRVLRSPRPVRVRSPVQVSPDIRRAGCADQSRKWLLA